MSIKKGKDSPYFVDHTGEIHINKQGEFVEITESFSWDSNTVKFPDGTLLYNKNYGNIIKGAIKNPNSPSVYGVGYFGIGKYESRIGGIKTPYYTCWASILARCYKKNKKHLTYVDCSVSTDWHNFQNFATWYEEHWQSHMVGWAVDKDILFKGNKIYSPETCDFVPRKINNIFTKRQNKRGDLPIGVTRDGKSFAANITKSGKKCFIKNFNTPEKAFNAYRELKEIYIKETAEEFKNQISKRIYKALLNYKVEITD